MITGSIYPFKAFHGGDLTLGKVYTIEGEDVDGDVYFIDDAGDVNYAVGNPGGIAIYEVIRGK